jgi:thioesterase domain-containing protein
VVDSADDSAETLLMRPRTARRAAAGHDVNAYLARYVPITLAMGIRLRSFDAAGVTMTAPLKPNINDKGIAFGGTLASILALSGWALTDLVLRGAGEAADVLIATATTEYRAPVSGRIVARCPLPPQEELSAFLSAYRLRGKARLKLEAFIETKAGPAALFHATYVARRPAVRQLGTR